MVYTIIFSREAEKDKKKLKAAGLERKAKELLVILMDDPYKNYPPVEKLIGNLSGNYSRRISIQHRLVYEVDEKEKVVYVKRMWTHYE